MARARALASCLMVAGCLLLSSHSAWAQLSPSGIAGVVRDTSGAVLPGVTVEAESPALIERTRVVYTDDQGRYNIVDLRPGTYAVTFTLPGFSVIRREGIVLTAGFTAQVSVDMQLGTLEETITVTGEAPLVDTQNTRQQLSVTAEVLDTLPTGQTNVVNLIALTPGYTGNADVGGSSGAWHGQQTKGAFHGKRGSHTKFDGMRIDNFHGSGDSPGYILNSQAVAEMVLESGGAGAESGAPNVGINMVPKEGANTFSYEVSGLYTDDQFQSNNLNDELRARGLQGIPGLDRMYDFGVTVGGPIRQDKVWFFGAFRRWGTRNRAAGLFWNKTQGTPFYTPDLDRPAHRDERYNSHAVRITWQASEKNKISVFADVKKDCICESGGAGSALGSGATNAQESQHYWNLWPNGLVSGTWTSPRTSRLLFEAGGAVSMFNYAGPLMPGVSEDHVSILEQSTNFRYNTPTSIFRKDRRSERYAQRFNVSYVTGTHVFKVGFQNDTARLLDASEGLGRPEAKGVWYTFLNAVPVSLTQQHLPRRVEYWQRAELGIYAQDQWTMNRLTLNYGLRFDYYNGYIPEVRQPETQFVPAVNYDAIHGAPNFKDVNPRLGAVYDLAGNGRTAFKVAFGRYMAMSNSGGTVGRYHPLTTSIGSVRRAWNDTNGNYIPDCDLANFGSNGECGPIANLNFGRANPNAIRYADEVRSGWGARPYTWDLSTEVQHELTRGISLTAGYYHNWDGNFEVTRNEAVDPSQYDPYCITAPVDPRLPDGGGYEVCGLYDVKPEAFGQSSEIVMRSSNFGDQKRVNDFFGVRVDTRFREGVRFSAALDTGRTLEDQCFIVNSPQDLLHCRVVRPFAGNTQIKMNGSYSLPRDVVVSGTFQNLSGSSYEAEISVPSAQIAPSLGRPLAGRARSATVPLVAPETLREPRRTQVDLRVSKIFRLAQGDRGRLQVNFDVYNAFNAAWVQGQNETFGPQWRQPTLILNGRLIQFSGNFSF